MLKIILLISIPGILQSCTQQTNTDLEALKSANLSLIHSIENISQNNKLIYTTFQQKLIESRSREKTEEWYPRASLIKKLSDDLYNEVEKIKYSVSGNAQIESRNKAKKNKLTSADKSALFDKLLRYKTAVLLIHPDIYHNFKHTISIGYTLQDKTDSTSAYFSKRYFSNTSDAGAMVILKDFQNRVRITENDLILYCLNQTSSTGCDINQRPRVIVNQSSSFVKPGGKIEINAGIGTFTLVPDPEVYINNKLSKVSTSGVATSFIKAANKPGTYTVPVKIKYVKDDGTDIIQTNNITYEVGQCFSNIP